MSSRWVALPLLAFAGCEGILQERSASIEVDGAFATVEPPPCDPPAAQVGDGHHNAGDDCGMCHHQGGSGPPFTYAGTLYASSGGATVVSGAAIHLIDSTGTDVVALSGTNGNFYTTELVTFPALAFASLCPDVVPMIGAVEPGQGSCNAAGCHNSGFRLHVP